MNGFHLFVVGLDQGVQIGGQSAIDVFAQLGDIELWNDAVVLGVDELDDSVTEITQVGQQFVVVSGLEVVPRELRVGVLTGTELRGWEDHRVERNVVLTHELVQLDFFWVLPPGFPFLGVVGCDGDVPDWSIEPNVKNFVFELLGWNWSPPLQVSGDTTWSQPFL
ncbi:hypothetical protein WICPIJ_008779 [Wickerhamomyces pijperi]|uniref:Uncharacterized protein n=1 Tax=Wickerhamomyces pijperi TaxID=599730 RepID=A0A9P8PWM3_WICPI|nr:hypothetical protein WICPIJ_008779 [Wickerhamomyces pijperi]